MTAPAMVELRGAEKRYGRGRWVLHAVTVSVPSAATVEVRGANGAGKSTLLRLLAGVGAPSRGRRRTRPGLRLGYAPDALAPPPLTLGSYLAHHASIRGLERVAARREIARLADRLGFQPLLGDRLTELSKGSLQKAVLAQALLGDPGLLVLDEPFSGLDVAAQSDLRALLAERVGAGASIVFSEHREGGSPLAADLLWHLGEGRVRVAVPRTHLVAG